MILQFGRQISVADDVALGCGKYAGRNTLISTQAVDNLLYVREALDLDGFSIPAREMWLTLLGDLVAPVKRKLLRPAR